MGDPFAGRCIRFNKSPRPTQPPSLGGLLNEYRPKCGDALRLYTDMGRLKNMGQVLPQRPYSLGLSRAADRVNARGPESEQNT